ncbi:hypothetical protein DFH06DRAFT_1476448 [Mycena polygramma]|nr:hypothetical protein DFH06DRAFT_1476448 [Mycena polygramma]
MSTNTSAAHCFNLPLRVRVTANVVPAASGFPGSCAPLDALLPPTLNSAPLGAYPPSNAKLRCDVALSALADHCGPLSSSAGQLALFTPPPTPRPAAALSSPATLALFIAVPSPSSDQHLTICRRQCADRALARCRSAFAIPTQTRVASVPTAASTAAPRSSRCIRAARGMSQERAVTSLDVRRAGANTDPTPAVRAASALLLLVRVRR